MNVSGNVTYGVDVTPLDEEGIRKDPLITLTVPAIMFASGVIGNCLAILVLLRSSKEHRQTVFYRLVGALAITDLFGTCAISPVTLSVYSNNLKWVGGTPLCNYESFMMIFAGFATIFIVGTMAVDRYIAIKHPFVYDEHVTYSKAKWVIVGLWLLAAFLGCLPLMGLGENVIQFPGTWCFFSFTSRAVKNQIFAYSYASIGLLVIGLTAGCNVFVTLVLLKMRRHARKTMNLGSTARHDSELQMMILLLGIIVIFSTCWCPFMIRIIVNQSNFRQVNVRSDLLALRLASLNQILDPWVYILFRREMVMRVIRFLREKLFARCLCPCGGSESDSPLTAGPGENGLKGKDNVAAVESRNTAVKVGDSDHDKEGADPSLGEDHQDSKLMPSCPLSLKHSSCLFCFANHPKKVVLTTISETTSKSAEALKLLPDSDFHDLHRASGMTPLGVSGCRRGSIHLSLGDLPHDHDHGHEHTHFPDADTVDLDCTSEC